MFGTKRARSQKLTPNIQHIKISMNLIEFPLKRIENPLNFKSFGTLKLWTFGLSHCMFGLGYWTFEFWIQYFNTKTLMVWIALLNNWDDSLIQWIGVKKLILWRFEVNHCFQKMSFFLFMCLVISQLSLMFVGQ